MAEYVALRSEAQARVVAQVTLVGFTLTAAAALSAVALTGDDPTGSPTSRGADGEPDRLVLLLLVPLVVNGLGLFFIQHNINRGRIAAYIRQHLWPVLRSGAPDGRPIGFGQYFFTAHASRQAFLSVVVTAGNVAIFTTSDVLALALYADRAFDQFSVETAVWILDVVMSIFLIVAAVVSASEYSRDLPAPLFSGKGMPPWLRRGPRRLTVREAAPDVETSRTSDH